MINQQKIDDLAKLASVDMEDDFAIDALIDLLEFIANDIGSQISDVDIFRLKAAWVRSAI